MSQALSMILKLSCRIIHVALPENAKVHVQPECHDIAGNHGLSQESSHVLEDIVGRKERENLVLAQEVQANVAEEEAKQAIHWIDQLAATFQHHSLFHLSWKYHLTQCLTAHPC